MDENAQGKTERKRTTTENKLWLPPLSPQDQKKLTHLQRNRQNSVKAIFKWTGFSGKTLWEWLQLLGVLAIPLVVVGVTIGFAWWQVHLADLQHQSDQQRSLDQQQAVILQTYLDNIQDLLLNHNLLTTKPDDHVAILARARTLTALQGLDPQRKGHLVQFLYEAKLIGFLELTSNNTYYQINPIINLDTANLHGADLKYANLRGADLSGVDLSNADLSGADLKYAKLRYVNLASANLSFANLFGATLFYANFRRANLKFATLDEADLRSVQLLTQQELDQVYSCRDAILPPELPCHKIGYP